MSGQQHRLFIILKVLFFSSALICFLLFVFYQNPANQFSERIGHQRFDNVLAQQRDVKEGEGAEGDEYYGLMNGTTPKRMEAVAVDDANGRQKKLTECRLPRVDPWDPAIMEYVNPKYCELFRRYRECVREYPEITKMKDGYVEVNKTMLRPDSVCQFRCMYPHTDYKLLLSDWQSTSTKPDCDVVEVECKEGANANNASAPGYYNYIHTQIYNGNKQLETPSSATAPPLPSLLYGIDVEETIAEEEAANNAQHRPPDVHLLIIDSVSHTQFLRSLPKTSLWLRERMDAIPFPHLNKVGKNSKPNAFALFFGYQVTPIEENPMGMAYQPERAQDVLNSMYLDREPFIAFEYQHTGKYRTMMAEDWARGAFNWPASYGFERPPVDHYMRPFQLRSEKMDDVNGTMTANLYKKSCKDYHHYVLDYLKQYIAAYPDEPKFSITWYADAAHYTVNGAFWIDEDFFTFFREFEKKMENAFVFVIGDHGLRFTGVRYTKPGEVEDNNPAMFMILPKHLRCNKRLMDNLRENARQMVTHFDTHATMVHIAKEASKWSIKSPFDQLSLPYSIYNSPDQQQSTPFGSTLLHRFDPSIPRHCGNLHVPFEFCICQFYKKNSTLENQELAVELAQIMVDKMNWELRQGKAAEECVPLALNSTQMVEILEFEPKKHTGLFQITYETVPGNGRFWGYIQLTNGSAIAGQPKNYTLITTRFPRLNEYGEQAKCIDESAQHDIAPYCYCRDLLTTTTPPMETTTTTVAANTLANDAVNLPTPKANAAAPNDGGSNKMADADQPLHLITSPDGTVWLAQDDDGKVGGGKTDYADNKAVASNDDDDKVMERLMGMLKKLKNERSMATGNKKGTAHK